jgi:SAM-dependent methyltransferase
MEIIYCKNDFMNSDLSAWDVEYVSRGCLWAGSVRGLPDLPTDSLILELGCGNGKTLSAINQRPWRAIAMDISSIALRLCKSANPEVPLVLGDASCLPFRNNAFDAVFAFHITGHLLKKSRESLAKEAARVLRTEGRLFFREFELNDMRKGKGEEIEPYTFRRGKGIITHYFTDEEAVDLFSDLKPDTVQIRRWKLRIKGENLYRSEIEAVFSKSLGFA